MIHQFINFVIRPPRYVQAFQLRITNPKISKNTYYLIRIISNLVERLLMGFSPHINESSSTILNSFPLFNNFLMYFSCVNNLCASVTGQTITQISIYGKGISLLQAEHTNDKTWRQVWTPVTRTLQLLFAANAF